MLTEPQDVHAAIAKAERQIRIRRAVLRLAQSPAWGSFGESLEATENGKIRRMKARGIDDVERRELAAEARTLEEIRRLPERAEGQIRALEAQINQQKQVLREMEAHTPREEVKHG